MYNSDKYKKWYEENKEMKKASVRSRRSKLRKQGLCITCGRQLTSGIASSRCCLCYEKNCENVLKHRILKPIY